MSTLKQLEIGGGDYNPFLQISSNVIIKASHELNFIHVH